LIRRKVSRPWSLHARTVFGWTPRRRAALVTESVATAGRLIDVMTFLAGTFSMEDS
jgi:hypothetical protein